MADIRITPAVQGLMVAGTLAVLSAAVAAQLPEIRRYLKVRAMD